jgi:Pentapeptide repeats (9 copies)
MKITATAVLHHSVTVVSPPQLGGRDGQCILCGENNINLVLCGRSSKMKQFVLAGTIFMGWMAIATIAQGADPRDLARLKQTGECKGCDLAGADLRNANLRDAKLDDANLQGADLSGANLKDVDFDRANLKYTNFKGALIDNTDFSDANLDGANIDLRELDRGDAKVCNAIMPDGRKRETNVEGFFGFGGCR